MKFSALTFAWIVSILCFVLACILLLLWFFDYPIWILSKSNYEPLSAFLLALSPIIVPVLKFFQSRRSLKSKNIVPTKHDREIMLDRVSNYWIKHGLEKTFYKFIALEIEFQMRRDLVDNPLNTLIDTPKNKSHEIPFKAEIIDVFDEQLRELLILGEPGTGKTTCLLQLARALILRAQNDEKEPIPIILNLSSWDDGDAALTDWIIKEINEIYFIPVQFASHWLQHEKLTLLLDRLDGVKPNLQEKCIYAINEFRKEYGVTPIVICSRLADYKACTTKLKLHTAVLLQLLSLTQVKRYFDAVGPEFRVLRESISKDKKLEELSKTPLMLNIMLSTYDVKQKYAFSSKASTESLRKHFFESYLNKNLDMNNAENIYSKSDAIRWLTYIAKMLSENKSTIFFLEYIKYGWLQTAIQKKIFELALFLINILIVVIIFFFGFLLTKTALMLVEKQLSSDFIKMMNANSLSLLLVYAPVLGFLNWGFSKKLIKVFGHVKIFEKTKWSWQSAKQSAPVGFFTGFVFGIMQYSILCFMIENGFATIEKGFSLNFEINKALLHGIGNSLFSCLVFFTYFGMTGVALDAKIKPNQGIWQSAKNSFSIAVVYCIVLWLIAAISLSIIQDMRQGLIFGMQMGIVFGVSLGIRKGGLAVIQHFVLRFILARNRLLPWNIIKFLDHCNQRKILQKIGGGYAFIHEMIQEYFFPSKNAQHESVIPVTKEGNKRKSRHKNRKMLRAKNGEEFVDNESKRTTSLSKVNSEVSLASTWISRAIQFFYLAMTMLFSSSILVWFYSSTLEAKWENISPNVKTVYEFLVSVAIIIAFLLPISESLYGFSRLRTDGKYARKFTIFHMSLVGLLILLVSGPIIYSSDITRQVAISISSFLPYLNEDFANIIMSVLFLFALGIALNISFVLLKQAFVQLKDYMKLMKP